jgi:alkylhydroperoxidase family enzyme
MRRLRLGWLLLLIVGVLGPALLQAADELYRESFISDATWRELARHYDTAQLIEIIFTVDGYTMTGLAINSLGIQVERGYPGMPKRRG